jgi:ferrochelatase
VLDMPAPLRWLLLNLVILPTRPHKSAEAYRSIWRPDGSPLLLISQTQRALLEQRLAGVPVVLAMRYGTPSIARAIEQLAQASIDEVILVPMYPQYASATTGSSVEAVSRALKSATRAMKLQVVSPFFDQPEFIAAWTERISRHLERAPVDHVVFSYHGLPERQLRKADASGRHCLSAATCCDSLGPSNQQCYRAQCLATSRSLASSLEIEKFSTTFQSRLGRAKWTAPYTEPHLAELARAGVRRLAVVSPAFVADCLETLEEISIRMKKIFLDAGGERFEVVPCLNDSPAWISALQSLVTAKLLAD